MLCTNPGGLPMDSGTQYNPPSLSLFYVFLTSPSKYQLVIFSPSDMGLWIKTLIHILIISQFIQQHFSSLARHYPQHPNANYLGCASVSWYKVYQVFQGQSGSNKYFKYTSLQISSSKEFQEFILDILKRYSLQHSS